MKRIQYNSPVCIKRPLRQRTCISDLDYLVQQQKAVHGLYISSLIDAAAEADAIISCDELEDYINKPC